MTFAYPHTPIIDQTDDCHGTFVPNLYRWWLQAKGGHRMGLPTAF